MEKKGVRVAVIGGGAAGMSAAIAAAEQGASVTLIEKNEKLGKKIYITGKGRCNYTNVCDFNTFIENIVSNPKFMYSSLRAFGPQDMTALLEEAGCRTKTERGNRAFPASDHASDITAALQRRMKALGVEVKLNTEAVKIESADASHSSETEETIAYKVTLCSALNGRKSIYTADRVIIATGGLSYPSTGSTGDGYSFAESLGLEVTKIRPALVPLEILEEDCGRLQGVSLKNVTVSISLDSGRKIYESETGELLFTHFGLSGPLILSASSLVGRYIDGGEGLRLAIDLKPALSTELLDRRILRDLETAPNSNIINALGKLLISSLRPIILGRCNIAYEKKACDISRKEREILAREIKAFTFTVTGTRGYNEAIITQGGVAVKELNPKTMGAKKSKGVYFAGEVLDVDAYTGGFNLQIAWSTGRAAGIAAAGNI